MTKHLHRLVLTIVAAATLVVAGAASALAMTELPQGGSNQRLPRGGSTVADAGTTVPWLYVGPAIAVVVIALVIFLAMRLRAHSATAQGA